MDTLFSPATQSQNLKNQCVMIVADLSSLKRTGVDFSFDENFSDRDTFRSLMAAEARGEGCVAEFVRPDSGGQK
jgi:hypothetical protein